MSGMNPIKASDFGPGFNSSFSGPLIQHVTWVNNENIAPVTKRSGFIPIEATDFGPGFNLSLMVPYTACHQSK